MLLNMHTPNDNHKELQKLKVLNDAYAKQIIIIEQQLAELKASLPKVRAEAVLSLLDTEYTCETPNGGSAWSSNDIEEHADKLEAGNEKAT